MLAEHERREHGAGERTRLPGHNRKKKWDKKPEKRLEKEEGALRSAEPVLGEYVVALKKKYGSRSASHIVKLYKLFLEYPTDAFVYGVRRALKYGQLDISRLETIILKNIAGDFFNLSISDKEHNDDR